jgi:hypothetical protein
MPVAVTKTLYTISNKDYGIIKYNYKKKCSLCQVYTNLSGTEISAVYLTKL